MSKKPNTKNESYNFWTDETAPGVQFLHDDFMKRLKEVHGIDPKTTSGTKRVLCHMDGDTWYAYEFEWEIAGKKFIQHTREERRGMDREIWAHGE